MSKIITLKPRLNEKTYAQSAQRVYVFDVDTSVNKHSVARAVEAQYEVKVAKVNTTTQAGKAKRIVSITGKRSVNAEGKRPDYKKAYVTLKEGFSLPLFEAVEEADAKQEATQAKVDAAVAKKEAKEAKKSRGKKEDK